MKFIAKIIVAICLVTTGGVMYANNASALLGGCTTMKVYESGYSKCTTGTGMQRIEIACVVNGSTQRFIVKGPFVYGGQWSVAHCPTMMRLVGMSIYLIP